MDVNTCTCNYTCAQLIIPKGLYNEQILLHGITDIQSYMYYCMGYIVCYWKVCEYKCNFTICFESH